MASAAPMDESLVDLGADGSDHAGPSVACWPAADGGSLVVASASGSQLAALAWGAANVILVVGAQKLVPNLEAAHERVYQHSLKLEDVRAQAAYGQHSSVGKILEIHQELPGRVHVILIRQVVGF